MKKLLIGTLMVSSFASHASTSTTTTSESSISTNKKYSISLRRDVNLQISGKTKFKANGFSESIKIASNELEGTTIAGEYTDILNDNLLYKIGASFSKIDPTSSGSDSNDYLEHLRLEGNFSSNFNERISGFAGLNISKFTRGEKIVDADAGLGFQFGLQARIANNLQADLRYWETNNSRTDKEGNVTINTDYKFSSTTLGVSYIF